MEISVKIFFILATLISSINATAIDSSQAPKDIIRAEMSMTCSKLFN